MFIYTVFLLSLLSISELPKYASAVTINNSTTYFSFDCSTGSVSGVGTFVVYTFVLSPVNSDNRLNIDSTNYDYNYCAIDNTGKSCISHGSSSYYTNVTQVIGTYTIPTSSSQLFCDKIPEFPGFEFDQYDTETESEKYLKNQLSLATGTFTDQTNEIIEGQQKVIDQLKQTIHQMDSQLNLTNTAVIQLGQLNGEMNDIVHERSTELIIASISSFAALLIAIMGVIKDCWMERKRSAQEKIKRDADRLLGDDQNNYNTIN